MFFWTKHLIKKESRVLDTAVFIKSLAATIRPVHFKYSSLYCHDFHLHYCDSYSSAIFSGNASCIQNTCHDFDIYSMHCSCNWDANICSESICPIRHCSLRSIFDKSSTKSSKVAKLSLALIGCLSIKESRSFIRYGSSSTLHVTFSEKRSKN